MIYDFGIKKKKITPTICVLRGRFEAITHFTYTHIYRTRVLLLINNLKTLFKITRILYFYGY